MGLFLTIAVSILGIGFLWFYIARPMLEDFGIIRDDDVNDIADAPPVVMSRSPEPDPRLSSSSLETDSMQRSDRPMITKPTEQQMLDIFKVLRAAGVSREKLRDPWRAAGLPLDNNLWSQAAPPAKEDDDTLITPYAGRVTKRSFYPDDPELEYRAPA